MKELCNLGINEILSGLNKKLFSSEELTVSLLEQIRSLEKLNSTTIIMDSHAIESAKRADKLRLLGKARPLEGVPIGVKDIFCTKGILSSACSKILNNFNPPYESTVTKNLLDKGAHIICKTNMDEFAMGSSNETSSFGPVINPWTSNESEPLVPGGSSGGSAALVAARGAPLALGTDTGGSIRQPAAFCGVVGFKPTYGRCSRYGIISFASSLDQAGPITRSVEDAALSLQYMSSFDIKDSTSVEIKNTDFLDTINNNIKGLRIGVPKEYKIDGMAKDVETFYKKGINWLESEGAEIIDISLPHTQYALPAYYILAPAEASANLARYDGVRYAYRAEGTFSDLDQMYSKTRAEGFGQEVKRRILIGTYVLSAGYYDAYYLRAQKIRRCIHQDFINVFKRVDAILTPTAPSGAFKLGEKSGDPVDMYLNDIFTVPASLAGLPAIAIPVGLDNQNKPLSLQVIGNAFEEKRILQIARTIERLANFEDFPFMIGK